jgi:DNA-binding NarL/FixJ family response regulator
MLDRCLLGRLENGVRILQASVPSVLLALFHSAHAGRVIARRALVAAKAKGVVLGRQVGQRPSDKKAKKVLSLHGEGLSYRLIARNVGLSKNTVMEIVRRAV